MGKTALITGVTGQDASYLVPFLLDKGYVVHGLRRRSSMIKTDRVDHLVKDPHEKDVRFFLHYGDLTDSTNVIRVIQETQPDEIYNLAAQSHVAVSFETPEYTANVDALGPLRVLEAVRLLGLTRKTRVFQASTSELFGKAQATPQNESTPFYPRSPYGVAKLYGYWITRNYREAYGIYACNGIFFNHESPTRGETFVTRKITRAVAAIALGMQETLYLGNLNAKRDWGHAEDYVTAMHMILQQEKPDDYVIATGRSSTVRDFIRMAFGEIGMGLEFINAEHDEQGVLAAVDRDKFYERVGLEPRHLEKGRVLVKVDHRYFRPTEVDDLRGDAARARAILGWRPQHTLEDLVKEMVASDLALARRHRP